MEAERPRQILSRNTTSSEPIHGLARAILPCRSNQHMQETELYFVIPTCRLRDVGETVERYDEHFRRNGHSVRMIVFDDSSPASQAKYYPVLEQTRTHNDLYYVGP